MSVPVVPAFAAGAPASSDRTPVDLGDAGSTGSSIGGGGGSMVRTIVGLAVVIAVIYGIAWVLRQVKQSRQQRAVGGLHSVSMVPLGSGRALHLVRAGSDLVLVGVADNGVTPVRHYNEQEARDAGLIDEWGDIVQPSGALAASAAGSGEDADADVAAPRRASGGRRLALPTPAMAVDTMRRWTVRR